MMAISRNVLIVQSRKNFSCVELPARKTCFDFGSSKVETVT